MQSFDMVSIFYSSPFWMHTHYPAGEKKREQKKREKKKQKKKRAAISNCISSTDLCL